MNIKRLVTALECSETHTKQIKQQIEYVNNELKREEFEISGYVYEVNKLVKYINNLIYEVEEIQDIFK